MWSSYKSVVFVLQGHVPLVFVGTVENVGNAKLLLDYHVNHLKVGMQLEIIEEFNIVRYFYF